LKNFDTLKDLQVTLDKDRPGALAKATTAIANAGINIEGFCEIDGNFHTVTNDPGATKKALESAGYKVRETDVVVFPAEDRPGRAPRHPRPASASAVVGAHVTFWHRGQYQLFRNSLG